MSEHDTSKSFFAQHDQIIVTQQELNPKLRNYIKFLTTHHPFCKDMKLDRHQLITRLSEFWPNDPDWLTQMKEVWKLIDDIVHTVPSYTVNHDILLRVMVADSGLDPASIPKSQEAAALASIDTAQGVLRSCVLPVLEKPLSLDSLKISAGLMILCQPQGHLPDPFVDYRDELGIDTSENLFEERHQDKLLLGNKAHIKPAAKPDIIRETIETEQKRSNEWEMLHHVKEEQEKKAFEEAGVATDTPVPEPHPTRENTPMHNLNHIHPGNDFKDG